MFFVNLVRVGWGRGRVDFLLNGEGQRVDPSEFLSEFGHNHPRLAHLGGGLS